MKYRQRLIEKLLRAQISKYSSDFPGDIWQKGKPGTSTSPWGHSLTRRGPSSPSSGKLPCSVARRVSIKIATIYISDSTKESRQHQIKYICEARDAMHPTGSQVGLASRLGSPVGQLALLVRHSLVLSWRCFDLNLSGSDSVFCLWFIYFDNCLSNQAEEGVTLFDTR